MSGGETTLPFKGDQPSDVGAGAQTTALVLAWSSHEPERVGEVACFLEGVYELGRGEQAGDARRVVFQRERPGSREPQPALTGPGISRRQLLLRLRDSALVVENLGRCPVRVNGERVEKTVVTAGDTILVEGQLLLYVSHRPVALEPLHHFPSHALRAFGEPDAFGVLGESATAWRLRDRLGFAARAPAHVIVVGESGTGKELVARAVHQLSSRSKGSFVARNAATFPEGLIDAELFGNVKNYPNPGMAERRGLIGEADGGTLFLDEIAELPLPLQSHLLRVLDEGGEYQRLGETAMRRSDLRLIGATNRELDALRTDLLARFTIRLDVPPLAERREDIPLLARHLLRRAARKSPDLVARFATDSAGVPRLDAALVEHLLHRAWPTNIRELDLTLWRALSTSTTDRVSLTDGVRALAVSNQQAVAPTPPAPPRELTADDLRAAVARHGGNLAEAARALGLSSRYALYRLLKKHGIDVDAIRS